MNKYAGMTARGFALDDIEVRSPPLVRREGWVGNIYVRSEWFKRAGEGHDPHQHDKEHVCACRKGALLIGIRQADGTEQTMILEPGSEDAVIPANTIHWATAIVDDTVMHCSGAQQFDETQRIPSC